MCTAGIPEETVSYFTQHGVYGSIRCYLWLQKIESVCVCVRALRPENPGLQASTAVTSRIIVTVPLTLLAGAARFGTASERQSCVHVCVCSSRLYAQKPRGEGFKNVPAVTNEQKKQREA